MYRVGRTAVSVVIAAHNEAANLPQLLNEVKEALDGRFTFEIVVVDDGSTDDTPRVLYSLRSSMPTLRYLRHARSAGQSPAIVTGIDHAQSAVIATLDGDGQNDPADLPEMIDLLLQPRFGRRVRMIAGHRTRRQDSWWRLFSCALPMPSADEFWLTGLRTPVVASRCFTAVCFCSFPDLITCIAFYLR